MSTATMAGIRRSNRELESACAKAFAVFGSTCRLSCSSHNGRDFRSYEAYASDEVWAEHATRAHVRVDYLTEYGRPKHITPQMWVWKSDFVTVSLEARYPFNIYWHEPGECDETGRRVRKAGLRPFAMNVSVSGGRRFGLVDWAEKRVGLLAWAETFKDAKTRAALLDGIKDADRSVADWKQGLADMAKGLEALE